MKDQRKSEIKVGITVDPTRRFTEFKGYTVTPLLLIPGSIEDCYNMEHYLHKKLSHIRYIPDNKFDGYTECFINCLNAKTR